MKELTKIFKRPIRWLISLILLPFKLLISLVGNVISIIISIILFIVLLYVIGFTLGVFTGPEFAQQYQFLFYR